MSNTSSNIATGTNDLLARLKDGVLVLTMNRPLRRNALSPPMLNALAEYLTLAETASEVGAVVLTGAGDAFCAGGDVKGMDAELTEGVAKRDTLPIDERIAQQRRNQRATAGKLWSMPKPTIAALPGPAAGAGLSLALACDLRIASESAVLTTAFARVGYSGDYGGTFFMTRLIGAARARELYFLSERIDANEALRLGLVNQVVPAARVEKTAFDVAKRLAEGPRVAFRYMKENLNRAISAPMEECLDLEATHHIHCGETEDHRNAVRAFVEKREPSFSGR